MAPPPRSDGKGGSKSEEDASPAASPRASSGGIKPWLPLLANLVLMPVMAYVTIVLVLAPRLNGTAASAKGEHGTEKASGKAAGGESKDPAGHKEKVKVPLKGKVLVNLAGSQGTRYLLANITLVGTSPELKALVEKNDDELRDAASSVLCTKTINDLEKPAAKNLIRAELISVFSNILGSGMIDEILLTEFAIQ